MYKKALMMVSVMVLSLGIAFTTSIPDATAQEQDQTEMQEQATAAIITGSVVDAETGDPVPNATVTLNGSDDSWTTDDTEETEQSENSATTDEYGTFTFDDIDAGSYTVSIEADGYQSAEESVDVTEEGANVEIEISKEM